MQRYALILAGGSGTRLWPMSTHAQPKQLIPFIHGKSLLQLAVERLRGLVPDDHVYLCAGLDHRDAILAALPGFDPQRFIGEPVGRDTLNAVALGTHVIGRVADTDAVVAVFTADHVIQPVDQFQRVVEKGYQVAEAHDPVLVTFGITPTHPATGYGYLELGDTFGGGGASRVNRFQEKPDAHTAADYLAAGPSRYLWNSGMFVWRHRTLMQAIQKYHPEHYAGIAKIGAQWDSPGRDEALRDVYPTLGKISIDYAVMEPASTDPAFAVVAVPMPLQWLDVGSWPSFMKTCDTDPHGNAAAGCTHVALETTNTLVASSDPGHTIATLGVDDLIIIHTPKATLVCRAEDAEKIKQLHAQVAAQLGPDLL